MNGFSLLEALVALTITLILSAATVQGLQTISRRGQDEALKNEMLQLLQHARTEASIQHRNISICPSRDQRTCGGDWSDGQLIFFDDAESGVIHDVRQIIAVHQMKTQHGYLQFKFYPHYRNYLIFHPLLSENNDNGKLLYCNYAASQPAWVLVINKEGEITERGGKELDCHHVLPVA